MATKGYLAMEDRSLESTGTGFYIHDIGAANYASVTQDLDEIKDAVADVTGCLIRRVEFKKDFPETFDSAPDDAGDREAKWLVRMRDTTQFLGAANTVPNLGWGSIFTFTIPGALKETFDDPDMIPTRLPNSDVADIVNNPHMAALVVALEANVRSQFNNQAVAPTQAVIEIVYVGRNN
jgi:hypothetical protein